AGVSVYARYPRVYASTPPKVTVWTAGVSEDRVEVPSGGGTVTWEVGFETAAPSGGVSVRVFDNCPACVGLPDWIDFPANTSRKMLTFTVPAGGETTGQYVELGVAGRSRLGVKRMP